MFRYQTFGLNITSEIDCADLLPGREGLPDVHVRHGPVPEQLENPIGQGVLYQVSTGLFLLKLDHIAKYLVCNGNEIIVDAAREADADALKSIFDPALRMW